MKRTETFLDAYPFPPPDSRSGNSVFQIPSPMAGGAKLENTLMKSNMNTNFNFFR